MAEFVGLDPAIENAGGTPMIVYIEENGNQVFQIGETLQTHSKRQKPKKTRAPVYKFFDWQEETSQWKCKLCGNMYIVPLSGGNGSLTNHMNRDHKQIFMDAKKSEADSKLTTLKQEKTGPREICKETFRKKLIDFMICTDQAFTLVEDPYFRDLIDYCSGSNKECELFCAKTAKNIMEDTYKENKIKVQNELKSNEGKISYIIDCWTSSNQYPFQGVIAKWISNDWELCSTVIDLTILKGSHNGKNIAAAFWGVLEDYGLCETLLSVTTDNAKNMDTMFEELVKLAVKNGLSFDEANYRVRCFAHILNLACKAMINCIGDGSADEYPSDIEDDDAVEEAPDKKKDLPVVVKMRKGVVAIRNSPQRREQFARQCIAAKLKPKIVLRDVRTRWNATLDMLERGKELAVPYDLTLTSIPKLKKYILDGEEWQKVFELIKLLSPFREATVMLSNEHSPTMSRVTAVYQELFNHLEKYTKNQADTSEPGPSKRMKKNSSEVTLYPEWLVQAAKQGLDKLEKYYPSTDGLVYIVGTVLDPRFKLSWYKATGWPKEWIDFCRKSVTDLYKAKYKPTQDDQTESVTKTCENQPSHLFQDLFNKQMRSFHKNSTDDELKKYLAESVVDPELIIKEKTGIDGSLGWWKLHQKEYPNVARMAKDFLPASATGVPVERLFSSGPDVVSTRRQSMDPKTIQMCVCLKAWVKNKHLFKQELQDAVTHKFGVIKMSEAEEDS